MSRPQGVTLLGSTGSVGCSTLDVLLRHTEKFSVYALTANQNASLVIEQALSCSPRYVVMTESIAAEQVRDSLKLQLPDTDVIFGEEALAKVASDDSVDVVMAGIVGSAGLIPTLAAAKSGKRLLLANKESLVMSGKLLMDAAKASGALIMPIDSEHNAIFQSLPATDTGVSMTGVEKILLTASGGPFRKLTTKELAVVTPQQAIKHPNWSMGTKISIDSASMMNKGLEVIEACHLFSVDVDMIEVLVHPESIVHSMVRYTDGSVIAQLGHPDMRIPIAHALSWPSRIASGVQPLEFTQLQGLHFEAPDQERFPALSLAIEAQRLGGTAPTVLNAANEIAVQAFIDSAVSFLQLFDVVEETLRYVKISPADDLTTIIEADKGARLVARNLVDGKRA